MLLLPSSGRLLFTTAIALHALSGCASSPSANAQDVASEQHQFSAERTIGADDIDAAVGEASRRSGIPETWIRAVMRAESAGDRSAVSPKGAMGLMQIMPGTWAELRAQYSLGDDPFDVRDNVLAGAMYLRQMYDRFGAPGFLAAYNAGPSPVARWESEIRDAGDPLLYMESIPYWETRGYVAIVMRNYWMYLRQADAPAPSRIDLAENDWPQFPKVR